MLTKNIGCSKKESYHAGKLVVSSIESRFWWLHLPPGWGSASFHREIREILNRVLPQCWIGRHGPNDNPLLWWPPRSPDLTPCDFFLWGYVKDTVYVPPLSRNLQELQNRIVAALGAVTTDMLQRVWQGIAYQLDVCRVTRDAYIEGLSMDSYLRSKRCSL
jgi:hypothetical protein